MQRNRVRRRLRAILAERAPAMPAGSYLVSVSPKASTSSFAELRTNLYEALEALSRQGPR